MELRCHFESSAFCVNLNAHLCMWSGQRQCPSTPPNSLESLSKGYRNPSHPDQLSYIDCWFFLLLLKPLLGLECCALKQSSSILVTKSINQRLCRNLSKMPGLSGLVRVKEENLPHASSQFRIQLYPRGSGTNCLNDLSETTIPFTHLGWAGLFSTSAKQDPSYVLS